MRIEVTQDDIDAGRPNNNLSCPLALAISRAADKPASVGQCSGRTFQAGNVHATDRRFWLPAMATLFVREFDAGKQVSPFDFELDLQTNQEHYGI